MRRVITRISFFNFFEIVAAFKGPNWDGHEIIIDNTAESSEESHEQNDVSELKHDCHAWYFGFKCSFKEAEECTNEEQYETMGHITEHDTE